MPAAPSYQSHDRGLVFCPAPADAAARRLPTALARTPGVEIGDVIAVEDRYLWNKVLWASAPVVVRDFVWPLDCHRFTRLFAQHIHHERSPEVTTVNDGWGTQKGDGREPGSRPRVLVPGTY